MTRAAPPVKVSSLEALKRLRKPRARPVHVHTPAKAYRRTAEKERVRRETGEERILPPAPRPPER